MKKTSKAMEWRYTVLIVRRSNCENMAQMNFQSFSDARVTCEFWRGRVDGMDFEVSLWDNEERCKLR